MLTEAGGALLLREEELKVLLRALVLDLLRGELKVALVHEPCIWAVLHVSFVKDDAGRHGAEGCGDKALGHALLGVHELLGEVAEDVSQ